LLLRCALENNPTHLNLLPVHMMMPPNADENYLLFNENLIGKQQQNNNNNNNHNNNHNNVSNRSTNTNKSFNESLK